MKSAIFLDRDGVLNSNTGFVNKPDDLVLLPGVAEALTRMRELGYDLYLISNQAGVARGHMTRADLRLITMRLQRLLFFQGAYLSGIYYCTHAPEEKCACRKPSPGLIYQAAVEHDLDLSQSFFIGDMLTDMFAAKRARVSSILVETGQPEHRRLAWLGCPDFVARDLAAAIHWIEGRT